MPLRNRNVVPPGGFRGDPYTIPSLKWNPSSAMLPFDMVVAEAQAAIINNPGSNLDPTWTSVQSLVDAAVCARLKNDSRWCWTQASLEAQQAAAAAQAARTGCPTCGKKRR